MTVFAAGKKMKNAWIIQAQAGGRRGNYLCGGGRKVSPNCLQLFSRDCTYRSFLFQIKVFCTLYDDDPCIFVALSR